jgi:hypothetical protein
VLDPPRLSTPSLPTLHLPPSNPVFSVVLLLASGSRSFPLSFYVYYGHRRHRQLCSSFHVTCISIFLSICHTPHQASIHTHPSAIHTYLYHCLRVHIFPPRLSNPQGFFDVGTGGVLHRLMHISFGGSLRFPLWISRRPPSNVVPFSPLPSPLVYHSSLDAILFGRTRVGFPDYFVSCIVCTCFRTHGLPRILPPTRLPIFRSFPHLLYRPGSPSPSRENNLLLCGPTFGTLCFPGGIRCCTFLDHFARTYPLCTRIRLAHPFTLLELVASCPVAKSRWLSVTNCIRSTIRLSFEPLVHLNNQP